jgi:hypothetical protein
MATTWGQFKAQVAAGLNPFGDCKVEIDATTYTALFNTYCLQYLKEFSQITKMFFARGVTATLAIGQSSIFTDDITVITTGPRTATIFEVTRLKLEDDWIPTAEANDIMATDVSEGISCWSHSRENQIIFDGSYASATKTITFQGWYDHPSFPGNSDNAVNGLSILVPASQVDTAVKYCVMKLLEGVAIDEPARVNLAELSDFLSVQIPRICSQNGFYIAGRRKVRGRGYANALYRP